MEESEVLIIGAGISGLLCAKSLSEAGRTVLVVDKGRGFGGRMATRRLGDARIDHGAQFLTARTPQFQRLVEDWVAGGHLREWFRHTPCDNEGSAYPRYCGVTGMTDVPKHLASTLEVRRSQRVRSLRREDDRWIAEAEGGMQFSAPVLVVTAPLPQALELLDTSGCDYAGRDLDDLRSVRYERGLALLAILEGPSGLPGFGGVRVDQRPLTWLADNKMKGISPDRSAVTIHADAAFAEEHWDSNDDVRGPLLAEAAKPLLASSVVESQCHRWGFTRPINPWHEPCFSNAGLGLFLAGDAFGGPRIEDAALSGVAAADRILSSFRA